MEVIARLIELKRLNLLREAMNVFVDVPESSLVDVLIFYIDRPNMDFEGLCLTPHMPMDFDPQEEDGGSRCLLSVWVFLPYYTCDTPFPVMDKETTNWLERKPRIDGIRKSQSSEMVMGRHKLEQLWQVGKKWHWEITLKKTKGEATPDDVMKLVSLKNSYIKTGQ